jgi:hypothetical protein
VQGVKLGTNSYHWDGRDFKTAPIANGLYVYTVTIEKNGKIQTKSRSILIMK